MGGAARIGIVSVLAALWAALPGAAQAQSHAFVNLDGLVEGNLVTGLSAGSGVGGDPITGSIGVYGASASPAVAANAAMVFDATCRGLGPTKCSGGEYDKFKPALGNVLMIARSVDDADRDGRVDKPDVHCCGGELRFDFTAFGTGQVRVVSMDVLDIEKGGSIELFAKGKLVATRPLTLTGDNGLATIAIDRSGIDRMDVTLKDSGAIDNLRLITEQPAPPPRVCGSLRVSAGALVVGRRTVVRAVVRDTLGAPFARRRVMARGAGVSTSATTGRMGFARLVVRPRRLGVIRFYVPRSARCVRRVGAGSVFRPPPLVLTG